jgi:DNA-binding NarL/FixJ family response regulator
MGSLRVLVVGEDDQALADAVTPWRSRDGIEVLGPVTLSTLHAAGASHREADVCLFIGGQDHRRTMEALGDLDDIDAPVLLVSPPGFDGANVLGAGVRGVLPHDVGVAALDAAVRAVASGLVVLDPALPAAGRSSGGLGGGGLVEELTARETEVVQLLAEGLSNKEIARRLGVSEHTVKSHVDAILGKLGAHSRTEAVTRAARSGLIIL